MKVGCRVTAHWHSHIGPLSKYQEQETEEGAAKTARVCLVKADVRLEEEVEAAFASAVEKLGPVSVLVANHAVFFSEDAATVDMPLDQWQYTLETNLTGSFLLARSFLRQLRLHASALSHASIVMVGSTAGLFGEAMHADYAASKSALQGGLLLSLKNEIVKLHPRGRVNAVAPGWVRTPMAQQAVERGEHLKALQTTPLKKIAEVADVTRLIVVLASDRVSGHVSGAVLPIHGGMEGRVLNPLL